MKSNVRKTKSMIFNFSKKHKFTTKLTVNNDRVEIVMEAKLLGTIITDDLKWNKNTKEIVRKAYQRMQLLNKAAHFTSAKGDLKKNLSNLCKEHSRAIFSSLAQQSQ
jgi:hypothetical protein